MNQGETAELIAKYRQNHSFINVELYTMEGYQSYSSSNPLTPATGVMLDGLGFIATGATWTGKLVALPGYVLPEDIKVVTHYDYGYESEMIRDAYYSGYIYATLPTPVRTTVTAMLTATPTNCLSRIRPTARPVTASMLCCG